MCRAIPSRTLDADIVLFDDLIVDGPGHLRIPRPELAEPFVLKPLCDIAPDARDPVDGRTIAERLAALGSVAGLDRVSIDLEAS